MKKGFKEAQEFQRKKLKEAGYGEGVISAAPAITVGASGVGLAAGALDSVTGETNITNSGEGLLNLGLATVPISGAISGGFIGAGTTPDKKEGLKDLKKYAKEESMKAQKEGNDPNAGANTYREKMSQGEAKYDEFLPGTGLTNIQVARARRGAAIGAAAMLVPTLLSMRDREQLANQSASLM